MRAADPAALREWLKRTIAGVRVDFAEVNEEGEPLYDFLTGKPTGATRGTSSRNRYLFLGGVVRLKEPGRWYMYAAADVGTPSDGGFLRDDELAFHPLETQDSAGFR